MGGRGEEEEKEREESMTSRYLPGLGLQEATGRSIPGSRRRKAESRSFMLFCPVPVWTVTTRASGFLELLGWVVSAI